MRKTERRVFAFKRLQLLLRGVAFSKIAPQNCINKSRLRAEPQLFGHLDRFMHRCVVWNAVQPEHLIEAKPEQNLQNGLLCPAFSALRDEPIERRLPTDGAKGKFLDKPAIRRG